MRSAPSARPCASPFLPAELTNASPELSPGTFRPTVRIVGGMNVRGEDRVAVVATDYAALSDDELVLHARMHDVHAFEALMRRYNRRLFRIARSILREDDLAEDAVQETHITAYTRLGCYEPMGRFGAWLSRLAVNEALMLKRAERPNRLSLNALSENTWAHSELIARRALDDDPSNVVHVRQLLELAIDALPNTFRPVFMLRVVEQLSISETAECLGLNEATVKTRLHRAQ